MRRQINRMQKIKTIKCINILNDNDFESLNKSINQLDFNLSYNTVGYGSEVREDDTPQFVHGPTYPPIWTNSVFIELFNRIHFDLHQYFDDVAITPKRAKVNILCSHVNAPLHHPPHTDIEYDGRQYSLIYYLNDTDGPTFFFDDNDKIIDKVDCKANSFICFPSNIKHASSNPVTQKIRRVVNYVFEINKANRPNFADNGRGNELDD